MPSRSRGSPLGRPPGRYALQHPRDVTSVVGPSRSKTHARRQSRTPGPRRPHNDKLHGRHSRRRRKQRELQEELDYLDSWLASDPRETFLTRNIALGDQGKSERRHHDNTSKRTGGTATNTTIGRRASRISDEHKKEFQPVHKVWMALQPAKEWRVHQEMLKQQQEQEMTTQPTLLPQTTIHILIPSNPPPMMTSTTTDNTATVTPTPTPTTLMPALPLTHTVSKPDLETVPHTELDMLTVTSPAATPRSLRMVASKA